jgi:DNA (cytosine-5)-methyltransferase 1
VSAYHNENDPFAAAWLENIIAAGIIPAGDVDRRSIVDVHPDDLKGYSHVHCFAGIGGWAIAARIAGWPDDREIWTGSCPCQPFSEVGKRTGFADERHLWPSWFRLIQKRGPATIFGEQVPEAIKFGWLDNVAADLEGEGYAFGSAVLSGCVVEARQERERLWFVARADGEPLVGPTEPRVERHSWPFEPDVARVAHGIPFYRSVVRAFGNAIIPRLAAEVISSVMELRP